VEGKTVRRREALGAVVLLLAAAVYLLYARRYSLATAAEPGPGVFPLASGLLLFVLAGWQGLHACRQRPGPGATSHDLSFRPARDVKPQLMIGALVAYLLALSWIGFPAATFILVLICSRLMGLREWGRPAALALGIVVCCYFLFAVWLKVPLPAGYWK
jgi:hypothetical protein